MQLWLGLIIKSINKLLESNYTILGHIDHIYKNKLSTKEKEVSEWDPTLEKYILNKLHNILYKIINIIDTIFMDQIEKFACTLKRGNNHLFITYIYNVNAILVQFLKNRKDKELVDKLAEIYKYLEDRGYKPNH